MLPSCCHPALHPHYGVKRETYVAGAIDALDPEIKVISLLVTDVQRDAAAIARKH